MSTRNVAPWLGIIVHHTDTEPHDGQTNAEHLAAIRKHHMANRGWSDIGYHWLVFADGEILPGRPMSEMGSHCRGKNGTHIGVALVGKLSEHPPTAAQARAAIALAASLSDNWDFHAAEIRPHSEFASTDCPGKCMDVDMFRRLVEAEIFRREHVAAASRGYDVEER